MVSQVGRLRIFAGAEGPAGRALRRPAGPRHGQFHGHERTGHRRRPAPPLALHVVLPLRRVPLRWRLRCRRCRSLFGMERSRKDGEVVRRAVLDKYRALGPITFHQLTVMLLFFLLINLWIWRNPKHVPGWGAFFDKSVPASTQSTLK